MGVAWGRHRRRRRSRWGAIVKVRRRVPSFGRRLRVFCGLRWLADEIAQSGRRTARRGPPSSDVAFGNTLNFRLPDDRHCWWRRARCNRFWRRKGVGKGRERLYRRWRGAVAGGKRERRDKDGGGQEESHRRDHLGLNGTEPSQSSATMATLRARSACAGWCCQVSQVDAIFSAVLGK